MRFWIVLGCVWIIVLSNRIGVLVHRFPNNRRPSICKDCRVTVSRIDLTAYILSLVAHNLSSYVTMLQSYDYCHCMSSLLFMSSNVLYVYNMSMLFSCMPLFLFPVLQLCLMCTGHAACGVPGVP